MNEKCGQCYMCKHFLRYFTKGVKKYNGTQYGWCCKKTAITEMHETCPLYEFKPFDKKQYGLTKYYLNSLLTDISAIRQILEEKEREEDL